MITSLWWVSGCGTGLILQSYSCFLYVHLAMHVGNPRLCKHICALLDLRRLILDIARSQTALVHARIRPLSEAF